MNKQEFCCNAQKEIKYTLKPPSNAQILHVVVTDETTPSRVKFIYEKEDMEDEVMKDHVTKYMECYDTPSLIEPLSSILGPFGLTAACDLILQGKCVLPPVVHPDIVEFFDHLKIDKKLLYEPPVNAYNSRTEDYIAYWKEFR